MMGNMSVTDHIGSHRKLSQIGNARKRQGGDSSKASVALVTTDLYITVFGSTVSVSTD